MVSHTLDNSATSACGVPLFGLSSDVPLCIDVSSCQRLCSENAHKGDLRGAWLEISQAVPNRTVQSIYRHGIRKLHSFKRGPWDREEQERLIHLVGPDMSLSAKWALCLGTTRHRSGHNSYVL